jgi:hypothetical protein
VWAANLAALEASSLAVDERALMNKLVWRRLHLHWQTFCESSSEGNRWIENRAAEYLHAQKLDSPIRTASHIVKMLFNAIGVNEDGNSAHSRVLSSLVGHRIISEVNHLNELKSQFRFV